MIGRKALRALALATVVWTCGTRRADAQVGQPTGMNPGLSANPFANPYANPFLNPAMTQTQMAPGAAALYFFAAQQANGGIGSGQLSGSRPPSRSNRPLATPAPEPDAGQRSTDTPGGGAAHYFNRGLKPVERTGRYYNRSGRFYGRNAR